jgi:hypothetical protein
MANEMEKIIKITENFWKKAKIEELKKEGIIANSDDKEIVAEFKDRSSPSQATIDSWKFLAEKFHKAAELVKGGYPGVFVRLLNGKEYDWKVEMEGLSFDRVCVILGCLKQAEKVLVERLESYEPEIFIEKKEEGEDNEE